MKILNKYPAIKKILILGLNAYSRFKRKREKIRLLKYYSSNPQECNTEIGQILDYLKCNPLSVYNYAWCDDYNNLIPDVRYDDVAQRNYVLHKGKKMYMKQGMTYEQVCHNYVSRIREQDVRNPHCYHVHMKDDHYSLIIDGGGGRGNVCFGLY